MAPLDATPDFDPQETREWLDALAGVLSAAGPDRAHYLIERLIDAARKEGAYLPFSREHRLHQHDPRRPAAADARRLRGRGAHPQLRALERDGDGRAREQAHQRRRAHRELRLRGHALRRGLQPLLARALRGRTAATSCSRRATARRASTRARSCSAGSSRSSSTTSGRRSTARGSRRIRTRGSCPTSGSSRPSRWASGR